MHVAGIFGLVYAWRVHAFKYMNVRVICVLTLLAYNDLVDKKCKRRKKKAKCTATHKKVKKNSHNNNNNNQQIWSLCKFDG